MGNDGLSEISEAPVVPPRQRLGDDIAAPTFDIPRARVADREPRRVIRSPSGRQVAAHDYLMDEYRAKQGLGQLPTSSGKQNSRRKGDMQMKKGTFLLCNVDGLID